MTLLAVKTFDKIRSLPYLLTTYRNEFIHASYLFAHITLQKRTIDFYICTFTGNQGTFGLVLEFEIQYTLDLRKPDLRKNFDLRKIVATTDLLVHKLFDLRKIF